MAVTDKTIANLIPAKKGDVRNPNGVPKGTKHVSTWIDKLLHDETFKTTVREGLKLKEYKGAPIKAILGAQIILAINGDSKAADLLFKYGYGTKTEIQHSGELNTGIADPVLAAEFADFIKSKTKS